MGNLMIMCTSMVVLLIFSTIRAVPAAVYTVGDSSGWSMSGDYTTWSSDKFFAVGDTLVFNYSPGHTVDEVNENDYKTCTTGNSIATDSSGATSIPLTAGPHYFICGIPGHCSGGMKVSVNVAPSSATGGSTATPDSPSSSTDAPLSSTTTAPTSAPAANTPYLAAPAPATIDSRSHVTESTSGATELLYPVVAMIFGFLVSSLA